jgi:hypothetical protein
MSCWYARGVRRGLCARAFWRPVLRSRTGLVSGGILVVVVASAALAATGGWAAAKQIDPGSRDGEARLYGVSCTSSSFCIAVDTYGHALTFDGTRWSKRVAVVPSPYHLWSVSCASSSFCLASSDDGTQIFNGTRWRTGPTPRGGVGDFSCTSSSFCLGLAAAGATVYDGSSWSKPVAINADPRRLVVDSISCASASFCVATEGSNFAPGIPIQATIYNGTTWSRSVVIDRRSGLLYASVSCTSRSFCLSIDNKANVTTYNGHMWSAPYKAAFGYDTDGPGITAVSCASSSFCAAVSDSGTAVVYEDGEWSKPTRVNFRPGGGPQLLNAVACPSRFFCAAVGGLNVALYRPHR